MFASLLVLNDLLEQKLTQSFWHLVPFTFCLNEAVYFTLFRLVGFEIGRDEVLSHFSTEYLPQGR